MSQPLDTFAHEFASLCPKCHKQLRVERRGTLTGWIFQARQCNCPETPEVPAPLKPAETSSEMPELGSRYEVHSVVGAGGMGTVWKVTDKLTGLTLAAKVLHKDLVEDSRAKARFEREVGLAKLLRHPNIVEIYNTGVCTDGSPFVVLDYLDGESLESKLRTGGPMPEKNAVELFIQICRAMEHAHTNNVIHRDLKPSNIYLVAGQAKIIDFGIAKTEKTEAVGRDNVTRTHEIIGSPPYMSPEQCMGAPTDERSDVYSLGCIMYEALTGAGPFPGKNVMMTLLEHIHQPPRPLRKQVPQLKLSRDIETIVMTCLQRNPGERYPDMASLRRDLELVIEGKQPLLLNRESASISLRVMLAAGAGLVVLATWALLKMHMIPQIGLAPDAQIKSVKQSDRVDFSAVSKQAQELCDQAIDKAQKQDQLGAIPLFKEAIQLWQTIPETESKRADAFFWMGWAEYGAAQSSQLQFSAAEHDAMASKDLYERVQGGQGEGVARALGLLAATYGEEGRLDEAIAILQRCLAIQTKNGGENTSAVGNTLGGLAYDFHRRGEDKKAIPLFEKAIKILEKLPDSARPLINDLRVYADCLRDQGDLKLADKMHERAERLDAQMRGAK